MCSTSWGLLTPFLCFYFSNVSSIREQAGENRLASLPFLQVSTPQSPADWWAFADTLTSSTKLFFICVHVGSPYLISLNLNTRRAAVGARKVPRTSRGDTPGDSAWLTSLSNGHGRHCENMTDVFMHSQCIWEQQLAAGNRVINGNFATKAKS